MAVDGDKPACRITWENTENERPLPLLASWSTLCGLALSGCLFVNEAESRGASWRHNLLLPVSLLPPLFPSRVYLPICSLSTNSPLRQLVARYLFPSCFVHVTYTHAFSYLERLYILRELKLWSYRNLNQVRRPRLHSDFWNFPTELKFEFLRRLKIGIKTSIGIFNTSQEAWAKFQRGRPRRNFWI